MNRKDIGLFMMMGDVNWKWKGEWEKIAEMRKSVCWSHMMRIKPMALFVAQSVFGAAMQATETLARWNEKPTQHPFVNKFSAENEKRSFRHHWPPPSAILDRCNDGNYCTSEKETNETRYRQKKKTKMNVSTPLSSLFLNSIIPFSYMFCSLRWLRLLQYSTDVDIYLFMYWSSDSGGKSILCRNWIHFSSDFATHKLQWREYVWAATERQIILTTN